MANIDRIVLALGVFRKSAISGYRLYRSIMIYIYIYIYIFPVGVWALEIHLDVLPRPTRQLGRFDWLVSVGRVDGLAW